MNSQFGVMPIWYT